MDARSALWACVVWSAVLTAGCGRPAATRPPSTGAEAAVKDYYDAPMRRDWDKAYASLDTQSQASCNPARFARLGSAYLAGLGFEPEAVRIRSCEEHGAEAVAHVVFTGRAADAGRSYRDGVTLRKSRASWGVVLTPGFGQGR